jgi:hypothetical protein
LMMCAHTTIADSAEAGAPEIEITPAMIEAGADILAFYDAETCRLGETVTQIFRAMLEERPSPQR